MRIAYLIAWRDGADSGPFRKMKGQITQWCARGHEVGLFVAAGRDAVDDWRRVGATHLTISTHSTGNKARERRQLAEAAIAWQPDLAYQRQGLYYPGQGRVARVCPIITEVNNNDREEWALLSRPKSFYNRMTRGLALSYCSGLVFVTSELQSLPAYRRWVDRAPSLVLGNGIDLRSVAEAGPAQTSRAPHLVFVGHHTAPWHGIEDLVALARARPAWHFDVIGRQPAQLADAPPNVVGHGQLLPEKYAGILAAADVAIGSLALHRQGINEASTLKVREYLATGLPVVMGTRDTDFPHGAPFLLEVPNRSGGVLEALHEVDQFVERWRGRRVPRAAISHLDLPDKEDVRLSFFEGVVHRAAARSHPERRQDR